MIDKLKAFVSKNKQEFDSAEPSQNLWKKIDARMEVKNPSSVSSKLLSKFKYFGLSATLLVIAVYFVTQKLNNSSSNELAQNIKDSALNNSGQWVKSNQNKSEVNEAGNNSGSDENDKDKISSTPKVNSANLIQDNAEEAKRDSVIENENTNAEQNKIQTDALPKEEVKAMPSNENNAIKSSKKTKLYIPEESDKMNWYSGTLYDGTSICSLLRAYKFPGQVTMDDNGTYTSRRTMKTISCSHLEAVNNITAVWLKGKTSKKITLSIKDGFKNILLLKSDGRKISPEAISHYYKGLGVISGYSGKYFDMIFKDKVELILFFKDAEEGDKISVDGIIEAVVSKP